MEHTEYEDLVRQTAIDKIYGCLFQYFKSRLIYRYIGRDTSILSKTIR